MLVFFHKNLRKGTAIVCRSVIIWFYRERPASIIANTVVLRRSRDWLGRWHDNVAKHGAHCEMSISHITANRAMLWDGTTWNKALDYKYKYSRLFLDDFFAALSHLANSNNCQLFSFINESIVIVSDSLLKNIYNLFVQVLSRKHLLLLYLLNCTHSIHTFFTVITTIFSFIYLWAQYPLKFKKIFCPYKLILLLHIHFTVSTSIFFCFPFLLSISFLVFVFEYFSPSYVWLSVNFSFVYFPNLSKNIVLISWIITSYVYYFGLNFRIISEKNLCNFLFINKLTSWQCKKVSVFPLSMFC